MQNVMVVRGNFWKYGYAICALRSAYLYIAMSEKIVLTVMKKTQPLRYSSDPGELPLYSGDLGTVMTVVQ